MPAIPPILMDGVVFLYKTRQEAEQHVKSGATAFILGKKIRGTDRSLLYLVSNRHVVWDGAASVIRVNRRDGGAPDIIETNPDQWVPHPDGDDIVMMFAQHLLDFRKHKIGYAPAEKLLSRGGVDEFDIAVGDDVFMTGRFVNFQGETNNLTAARFGSISVMLSKVGHPLYKRSFESFAVEMRSRTGFSGSPVFV